MRQVKILLNPSYHPALDEDGNLVLTVPEGEATLALVEAPVNAHGIRPMPLAVHISSDNYLHT